MKFLLVPLLIIGMFISFAAALVAMLFFTQTIKTPQGLIDLVLGNKDSTKVFDEFSQPEDRLTELAKLTEEYKERYEEITARATAQAESLAAEAETRLEDLEEKQREQGSQPDSASVREREKRLKQLAKFYDKIKAQRAAEILENGGELSDTTVAELMMMLQPQQMAKIMGNMDAKFAARITKVMKELPNK